MKKMIILYVISLFMIPTIVNAEVYDYTNDDANIQFTIDESVWEPTDLTEEREYIELKWTDDSCGVLMYGVTDIYYELSSDERDEYSRDEYNYTLITNADAKVFAEDMGNYYDYGIKNYNMKFVYIEGNNYYDMGISADYHMYMTLNNGHLVQFQYYGDMSKSCLNKVIDVVKTTESTVYVPNSSSEGTWGVRIIVSLFLTIFCYMIYPFVRVILMKKIYNEESCKKMAMWNSIIVGGIFMILTIDSGGVWNAAPAFIYYSINKKIWINKKKNNNSAIDNSSNLYFQDEENEENSTIDNDKQNQVQEEFLEQVNKTNELEKLYNQGVLNVQLGQYDTASKELKNYIKEVENLKKESQENWYTFSNCVEFIMYVRENEEDSKNIMDVDYETSNAYLYLSMIDFEKGNYDEAIKNINKSLKWNPNNVNALFEKAENYKVKGELKEYYSITLDLYDKIYNLKDLAHYYRNLGYYFIENEEWDLAKTLYLYSVRFENNNVAHDELKYILSKSKDNTLTEKEDLEDILKENRIPTYISKNVIKCVKELTEKIIEEEKEDSNVGKFLTKLNKELQDNNK